MLPERTTWIGPGERPEARGWWCTATERDEPPVPWEFESPLLRLLAHRMRRRRERRLLLRRAVGPVVPGTAGSA